jgi:hypothetical protein
MSGVYPDRRLSVSSGRRQPALGTRPGRDLQRQTKPLTKGQLVTNLTGSMENVEDER